MPIQRSFPFPAVVALALGLAATAAAAQGSPRAVVPEPVWDGGAVSQGEAVEHDFVLRNDGDADLLVREVRPACGCTVADFDERIPPGGEGRVRAAVETDSFRGPIAKGVTVFTNDAANPAIELTIKADVRLAVEVVPGYVQLRHVVGEPPPTSTQIVWATNGRHLELTPPTASTPGIDVAVRPAAPDERRSEGPAEQWAVVVSLAPDVPPGPINVPVAIATNHPQKPQIEIPVTGYVRPRLMTVPPVADFGRFRSTDPRKGSVLVSVQGAAPVTLTAVTTDVPGLTARLEEEEPGRKYTIQMTLRSGLPSGPVDGALRVATDDPANPILEIPVRGTVQ